MRPTRRLHQVDDLVTALGVDSGISKSEVSRICANLDEEIGAWLARPLDHIAFRYVLLDATYVKAESVAPARHTRAPGWPPRPSWSPWACPPTGAGRSLGTAVGDSEHEAFWTEFLRNLRDRGLMVGPAGVQQVLRRPPGLRAAIDPLELLAADPDPTSVAALSVGAIEADLNRPAAVTGL